MSDAAPPRFDLRQQLIRIDRTIAETQRLQAETQKLTSEANKRALEARGFGTESIKLTAEAEEFRRDLWFVLVGAVIAILAGFAARLPDILCAFSICH